MRTKRIDFNPCGRKRWFLKNFPNNIKDEGMFLSYFCHTVKETKVIKDRLTKAGYTVYNHTFDGKIC